MERQITEKKCDFCGTVEQFPGLRPGESPKRSIENWITLVMFKIMPQGSVQQVNKQACMTTCGISLLKQHVEEKLSRIDEATTEKAEAVLKRLDGSLPQVPDVVKH